VPASLFPLTLKNGLASWVGWSQMSHFLLLFFRPRSTFRRREVLLALLLPTERSRGTPPFEEKRKDVFVLYVLKLLWLLFFAILPVPIMSA